MITISERTEYVAAHVRPQAKNALKTEAFNTSESVSKIISDAVERELTSRGYDLTKPIRLPGEQPLPFPA